MKLPHLFAFLAIAFVLSWGIIEFAVVFHEQMVSIFGELSIQTPLFFLSVWAPAIAAFTMILKSAGWAGFKRYLSRMLLWRVHWLWYAYLLVGIPAVFYLGAVTKGLAGTELFPISSFSTYLPTLVMMLFLGPMEEFGWRGVIRAVPKTRRSRTAIKPWLQRFSLNWTGT